MRGAPGREHHAELTFVRAGKRIGTGAYTPGMMMHNAPLLIVITLAMLVGSLLSAAWLDTIHNKLRK
jgi:hypothetical protein